MFRLILAGLFLFTGLFVATTFADSESARVQAETFFTAEQIEVGLHYAFQRRLLMWAGIFLDLGFLALLIATPLTRRITDRCERLVGGRWLPALFVVGILFFAAQALLHFPLSFARFRQSQAWGMTSRDLPQWLADYAKSLAVGAVEAAILLVCFYSLMRWFPRRWWLAATALGAVLAAAYAMLLPVVIEPIFNDFAPLSQTSWAHLEPMVRELVDRAGVPVEEVLVVDASRQTNHSNAYFTGFGATRRIVLYDTLLKGHSPDEIASIVGHELGHWRENHIYKGIALALGGAMIGFFVLSRILLWALGRGALALRCPSDPAGLPLVALLIVLGSWIVAPVENAIARSFERQADQAALELAHQPEAFIEAERKLAINNKSNVAPNPFSIWLFASHPSPVERILMAKTWVESRQSGAGK